MARRFAGFLHGRGVGPGDVVALLLPNWVEAAVVYWGALLVGAVVTPIVHFYGPKELDFILGDVRPRLFVTADQFGRMDYLATLEATRASLEEVEIVAVVGRPPAGTVPFSQLLETDPIEGPATGEPRQPAIVSYTSGTTANPKGVVYSHETLEGECRQMEAFQVPVEAHPLLTGAPIGHGGGMLGGLTYPLFRYHGADIHLIDSWKPGAVLRALVDGDLRFSGGSPYFLTSLLDSPEFRPEHLAYIPTAGFGTSPIPRAVVDRANELGIRTGRMYGSTEHPTTTALTFTDGAERRYSDGRSMPSVELRLLNDVHKPVEPGVPGDLFTRGPDLFIGYTDPALTARVFDEDGWYDTGDIGVIDEAGYLTITDRKKDIIIRGGENISAAEVEEALLRVPGVLEAAVVAAPDANFGERCCAFVRVGPDSVPLDLQQVRSRLARIGLGRQKWPEDLRVVGDFPRTAVGKIKKAELRSLLTTELVEGSPRR
jgi:acyl-CoA synthetase (AMP-forming)/AMP-acid ligase II